MKAAVATLGPEPATGTDSIDAVERAPAVPRRSAAFHVLLVSGTRYGAEALFMLRGLSVARLLGPELFGVWASMRLVLVFSLFSDLGGEAGMVRLAPEAVGAGDRAAAERYRGAAATVRAVATLCVVAALGTFVVLRPPTGPAGVAVWLALAAVIAASQAQTFYQACLRSTHRFEHASAALFAFALLSTVAGVAAAWRFGLLGFVIALAGTYSGVFVVSVAAGGAFPRPNLHWPSIRAVVGTGFGITIAGMLAVLQWHTDKLMLWLFAGSTALGLYTLPTYLTNAIQMLPHAMAGVLYPRMLEALGRRESHTVVHPYLEEIAVAATRFACPWLGLMAVALHLPIRWLFPEYEAAILPGRMLILASFFPVLNCMPTTVLLALSAQRSLALIRAAGVFLTAAVLVIVLQRGGGLVHVAAVSFIAIACQSGAILLLVARVAHLPRANVLTMLHRVGMPFAGLLALLGAAWFLIPESSAAGWDEATRTMARGLIVTVPLLPWAWQGARRLRHMG